MNHFSSRFSNGRYSNDTPDECKLVVMSDRAYRSIVCEACSEIGTETGGILLGRVINGVWFIVEVIDPGLDVTLRPELFSYDANYVNHLIPKISKIYDYSLDIIGIWHRHPGSMDFFSSIDDDSHNKLIHEDLNKTIISMLVNFDPRFRMTMYYVDPQIIYHKTDLLIGDDQMIPELLALADVDQLFKRFNLPERTPIKDVDRCNHTDINDDKGPEIADVLPQDDHQNKDSSNDIETDQKSSLEDKTKEKEFEIVNKDSSKSKQGFKKFKFLKRR